MCVSAGASFGLSGVLLLTGAYCVTRAVRCDRRLIPLAAMPLVFSFQQFCEGWVWVGINHSEPRLMRGAALVFLFFALCFWPAWIPFSTLAVETRKRVKVFLRVVTFLGVILGACFYLPIAMNPEWLEVEVIRHSIHYNTDASPFVDMLPSTVWEVVYLVIVAVPLCVSPVRRIYFFGLAVVLSAAVSHVFFSYAASSVWCLFAAGLSVYLGVLFFRMGRAMVGT